jgi:flagellar hook-length control protein FliK
MNATPPVSQSQPSNDALQLNASASAGSQASQANSRDFAGALNDAGDKPARKNTMSKAHDADSSGAQLPPHGNKPPLAVTPPPPARTDAAPATQASAGALAAPGAPGMPVTTGAAAKAPGAAAKGQPVSGDAAPAAAMAPPPASVAAAGDDLIHGAGLEAGAPSTAPGLSMTAPDAAGLNSAAVSVLSGSAAGAPAPTARVPAASSAGSAKPTAGAASVDGTSVKANIAAATSAPTSNDSSAAALAGATPDAASPPADTGAAAQALMAAAMAQATSAPTTQSAPPADDLATPDTGAAPQGVVGSGAPATAVAAAAAHSSASIAAAVRAASALSIAQAVSASADAGAADKHSRGSGSDFSLTGASNDGTAGAAQLVTSSAATDAAPPPTLKVSAGVDTAEFGQGVADRVSLMMDSNLTSAKLQVNPPALGPIEVRIALQGGHAQVWFTSHSAVTRDALESSSPKLREMLGAQGFGQVSVDISQRSFQERSPQSHGYEGMPAIRGESSASVQTPSATLRAASGLLDAYA